MKELRCIVFTNQEVVAAILNRRLRLGDPVPQGRPTGVRIDAADQLRVHVEINGGQDTLVVTEPEAQAALLAYCMGQNVPLPVEAEKSLHLVKDAVALMISLNFKGSGHHR